MSVRATILAWASAVVWAAGCASETPSVNPAPVAAIDAAPPDAPSLPDVQVDAEPPREAGPVKRLVFDRSPFGNLEHAGDLLMDPDFEWSTGAGQTGWVAMSADGQERVDVETGGLCRSGLRCVRIAGSSALYGRATGATSGAAKLLLWAKVPGSACGIVNIYVVRAMTYGVVLDAPVSPVTDAPDANGWCRFEGTAPPQPEALGVYVELKPTILNTWAILDDASLQPADGMSALSVARAQPVDKATQQRVRDRLESIGKRRWYGRMPSDRQRW